MGGFEEFKINNGYADTWPHVDGTYLLHDVTDKQISLDTAVIEYRIDNRTYPICTVADLFRTEFKIKERTEGSVRGLLAERIARRMTKRFLQSYHPQGRIGGLFRKVAHDKTIEHNDEYVLRINDYPNVIILQVHPEKEGADKYEVIAESDGLFDYRIGNEQHIIDMESKAARMNVPLANFAKHIAKPLHSLRPQASLEYLIVAHQGRIFRRQHILQPHCAAIYHKLQKENVQALFMPFNESFEDFRKMRQHWIAQYQHIKSDRKALRGAMVYSENEIIGFDREHMILIHLRKKNGVWQDMQRKSTKVN